MRNRAGRLACVIASGLVMLSTPERTASAQPAIELPRPPGDQPQVPALRLAKDPAIAYGTVAAVRGNADAEGLKFTLGGLSILQPVVVALFAEDAADDLKLTLYKKDWTEPRRAGSTGTARSVELTFRTEGGVNILVQSSGPSRPFTLVALAGEEIRPRMKDIIVTPAAFRGGGRAAANGGAAAGPAAPGQSDIANEGRSDRSILTWVIPSTLGLVGLAIGLYVRSRARRKSDV